MRGRGVEVLETLFYFKILWHVYLLRVRDGYIEKIKMENYAMTELRKKYQKI